MFSAAGKTAAVATAANYIEDVFNTWLFNAGASFLDQVSVNNGVDYTKGAALTITKTRSVTGVPAWVDTVRGQDYSLWSNSTAGEVYQSNGVINGLTSSGFTWLTGSGQGNATVASWTFRKQKKFFDIVKWTGDGNTSKTISHNLGSVPGCIITKMTSGINNWQTYHRSLGNTQAVQLNLTNAASTNTGFWNNTSPTATEFTVGTVENAEYEEYIAYIFAHDAGGFGLTGTDNVISCGSFTVDGSGNSSINLGYEPQWLLMKQTNTTGSWLMQDTMRGQTADNGYARLLADTSGAETSTTTGFIRINATGFSTNGATGLVGDHIYIAIRRGPMKTPTTGTSVFNPVTYTGLSAAQTISCGNLPDFLLVRRNIACDNNVYTRLTGRNRQLYTNLTLREIDQTTNYGVTAFLNTSWSFGLNANNENLNGEASIGLSFSRAPGFFDVVCYTGNGAQTARNHNLGVVPELMLLKRRSTGGGDWDVSTSFGASTYSRSALPYTNAFTTLSYGTGVTYGAAPTATTFTTSQDAGYNESGATFVAYLFASCPGVSKVGTYTGSGTTKQIDCGFTGGARFVLIKRTDDTGDWYFWDSARGIVSGNDPYLLLNSDASQVTNTDYVDTYSAGFEISSTAPAAINANGGTFVFLAVA
jgi:hypothetical protein